MALAQISGTEIVGLVSVVPKNTEDNLLLSIVPLEEREALLTHTGIRYRKINNNPQLGVKHFFKKGIETLLDNLAWQKDSIDIIVCVTQTPQIAIPSVACQIHGDLGFNTDVLCYDINSGCSGFVYGLHTVSALMQTILKNKVRALLCCGDVSSQLIENSDRATRPIFSDAVSVIGLEYNKENTQATGYFNLETAGIGQQVIYSETVDNKQYMRLNGIDIFNYSLKMVPKNINDLLNNTCKEVDFCDLFVFHQANKLINEAVRKKLTLPENKVPSSLYHFGNTASASIPLTLGLNWTHANLKSGWILVSGFGVGFSVASALIRFNPKVCLAPLEI